VDHQSAVERNLTQRYVLGELDAAEAAEFEEHFFECSECAEDVRRTSEFAANLKALLRDNTSR
jgi:anti-sigma factor RsiW